MASGRQGVIAPCPKLFSQHGKVSHDYSVCLLLIGSTATIDARLRLISSPMLDDGLPDYSVCLLLIGSTATPHPSLDSALGRVEGTNGRRNLAPPLLYLPILSLFATRGMQQILQISVPTIINSIANLEPGNA
jgi:hypothetical protein